MRSLMDWQPAGVRHLVTIKPEMEGKPHALLAADMGLGKTDMAAAAVKELGFETVLILCPLGVIYHWKRTLIEWGFKESDIFIVEKGGQKIPKTAKIIICNYHKILIANIRHQLQERRFQVLIKDEVQYLKNYSGKMTTFVYRDKKVKGEIVEKALNNCCYFKFNLSGTPTPNDLMELYPHARTEASHLLGEFNTYEKFGKEFSYKFCRGGELGFYGSKNTRKLKKMLAPYMMTMRAEDVFKDMPQVLIEPIYIQIPFVGGDVHDTHMATLRQLVGAAKVPFIVQYAKDQVMTTGEKYVIYTYSREVTEKVCAELQMYKAVKYYGGMSLKQKEAAKDTFINDPDCKFFVVQMVAGGTGTDGLQLVCYNMIFAEWDWTGGGFKQQIARLQRLLQKSQYVYVHALIAEDTLDERIIQRRKEKVKTIDILREKEIFNMSFDQQLADLTAAIKENTAVLRSMGKQEPSGSETTKGGSAKPAEKTASDKSSAPSAGASKDAKPAKETAPKLTAEDLRKAADQLVKPEGATADDIKANRAILKEIMGETLIKDVKPAQVAEFHAKITAAIAARDEASNEAGNESEEY